jgi:hypothetical protein
MQMDTLPETEVEKIRATLEPVIAKHSQTIGEAFVQEVLAEVATVRGKN